MDKQNDEITIDLRKIFFQIWKNKTLIALITLIFALIGYLGSAFFISPKYQATADLIVNNRNEENSSSSTTISNSDLQASSNLVDTYSVILTEHELMQQVISDLGLDYSYETLKSKISVTSVNSTQVMRVTVTDGEAEEALRIVTDLVRLAPERIMTAVNAGSVAVVDQPWTSGKPVSPNVMRNTMIAGLIGLMLCLAEIVIMEILNDKFKTTEDIRTVLDLPVLGVIPVEETDKKSEKKRRKSSTSRRKKKA